MGEEFELGRSVGPYVGQAIIIFAVTAFSAIVGIKTRQWGLVDSIAVMWALFGVLIYVGARYRLFWRGDEVVQMASGADVTIKAADISKVVLETSNAVEIIQQRRPFRRIAIYGRGEGTQEPFIDVSLKHFSETDIKKLMREIARLRPDLAMPRHWL